MSFRESWGTQKEPRRAKSDKKNNVNTLSASLLHVTKRQDPFPNVWPSILNWTYPEDSALHKLSDVNLTERLKGLCLEALLWTSFIGPLHDGGSFEYPLFLWNDGRTSHIDWNVLTNEFISLLSFFRALCSCCRNPIFFNGWQWCPNGESHSSENPWEVPASWEVIYAQTTTWWEARGQMLGTLEQLFNILLQPSLHL